MNGLSYTLRLIEPVLLNSLEGGDANSAKSLSYIPGSVIRGAVISAYLKSNHFADADDSQFRSLFLDGSTRYLHAFPDDEGYRTLPTPLSWKVRKDDADGSETTPVDVFDFSQEK
ncbi:MAG: RAMP superfamily protein, partial [bacterium]|nr:RAMP superfamily protein [bacterium]